MKYLSDLDLKNKKIGLRVDLNVPIDNGEILSHERLSAALPTILEILKHTRRLCIISHLGRPVEGNFSESLSLEPIKKWFEKRLNKSIPLIKNLEEIPDDLCFLENIRFFDGESSNDKKFARMLANQFDIYVMDAFATAHRSSVSTYGAISLAKEACAGLLFSKEVKNLRAALNEDNQIISIIGGSKISTKLSVIENLIEKSQSVLVGGGIANTFIKASGFEVGASLVEDKMLDISKRLLQTNKIILPKKVYTAESPQSTIVSSVNIDQVKKNEMILDIEFNESEVSKKNSPFILWNGPLGIFEIEQFSTGTRQLINFLGETDSKVIAGGGETIYAINKFSELSKFHYVSTAGGAFLKYLSGAQLPSIEALELK